MITLRKRSIEVVPLQQSLVGKVRPLHRVDGCVILICVVSLNIGGLLLARASGRRRKRWQCARQWEQADGSGKMLRSSLGFIGGIAGLTTAVIMLKAVLRFVPSNLPRLGEVNSLAGAGIRVTVTTSDRATTWAATAFLEGGAWRARCARARAAGRGAKCSARRTDGVGGSAFARSC